MVGSVLENSDFEINMLSYSGAKVKEPGETYNIYSDNFEPNTFNFKTFWFFVPIYIISVLMETVLRWREINMRQDKHFSYFLFHFGSTV